MEEDKRNTVGERKKERKKKKKKAAMRRARLPQSNWIAF